MQNFTIEASAIAIIAAAIDPSNTEAVKAVARLQAQITPAAPVLLHALLKRPIVFFDLETTGTDTATARIVELGFIKIYPDGRKESGSLTINPGCLIPEEASAIHGITDEMVAGAPSFKEYAPDLFKELEGADVAGYNSNRFDVPLLAEEFSRAGYIWPAPGTLMLDAYNIYAKNETRKLADALLFYTGKKLENAHSASADIEATVEILVAQLAFYEELRAKDLAELHTYCKQNPKAVDLAGKLELNEAGQVCWTFGKYKGKPVETDAGYLEWVLRQDMPGETKAILQAQLM